MVVSSALKHLGTYSSIYIANVVLIWLNLTSEDLIPPQAKDTVDDRP